MIEQISLADYPYFVAWDAGSKEHYEATGEVHSKAAHLALVDIEGRRAIALFDTPEKCRRFMLRYLRKTGYLSPKEVDSHIADGTPLVHFMTMSDYVDEQGLSELVAAETIYVAQMDAASTAAEWVRSRGYEWVVLNPTSVFVTMVDMVPLWRCR